MSQIIYVGWTLITGTYFITLLFASWAYMALTGLPIDHSRNISGLVIGTFMVVLPYLIGGYFVGKTVKQDVSKIAIWVGIVPSLSEKVLIYFIAALFVSAGGDGGGDGIVNYTNVMGFASAEAVPYFRTPYLLTFPISILVCLVTSKLINKNQNKAY